MRSKFTTEFDARMRPEPKVSLLRTNLLFNIFVSRWKPWIEREFFRFFTEKMSSDSSDEENLEFLKEAQDSQFINDSMFSEDPKESVKVLNNRNGEALPSLRPIKDEDDQFNPLKVTPGFRSYVAKQLSQILDKQLREVLVDVQSDEIPKKKRRKGGVKLFSDSKYYLKPSKKQANHSDICIVQSVNQKKPYRYSKLSVSVPEELLKTVAVSAEDILSKKEVQNWSSRSKAPVFQYKTTKNGKLVLVEPEFK